MPVPRVDAFYAWGTGESACATLPFMSATPGPPKGLPGVQGASPPARDINALVPANIGATRGFFFTTLRCEYVIRFNYASPATGAEGLCLTVPDRADDRRGQKTSVR